MGFRMGDKVNPAHSEGVGSGASGKDDFKRIVDNIARDGKFSRKEVDALVAVEYDSSIPKHQGDARTPQRLRAGGHIGLYTDWDADVTFGEDQQIDDPEEMKEKRQFLRDGDAAETAREISKSDRTLARRGMFVTDGTNIKPEVPENLKADVDHMVRIVGPDGEDAEGSSIASQGITHRGSGTSVVYKSQSDDRSGFAAVHEGIHQYSHQNVVQLPTQLREGLTQYFAINALRNNGSLHGGMKSRYEGSEREAFRLSGIVGDDVLRLAYFGGDIKGLAAAFENKAGAGSWGRYLSALGGASALDAEGMRSNMDVFFGRDDLQAVRDAGDAGIRVYEVIRGEDKAETPVFDGVI